MKRVILLLIIAFLGKDGFGQTVSGGVYNENDKPIAGVHIINLTNKNHTHSNDLGEFVLQETSSGDTLKFTHLGYLSNLAIVDSLLNPMSVVLVESFLSIDEVVIVPKLDALNLITDIDIHVNPVNSSQDILRQVPGLIIGQHAGGGKAEQMFLRGFDVDHGTDITITVDDMPVNMVSHAHGQGYADLHFVIPETVDKIDFGKGPYYADKGNFNTAGFVDFKTKQSLKNSVLKLEAGSFNSNRVLGMFNLVDNEKEKGYVATEYLTTDGPFESPQNFDRFNFFGKYSKRINGTDRLGVTISHFVSKWDASGQIPQRLVDDGTISRFGAVDDTEGGVTDRTNLLIEHTKFINEESFIKSKIYYINYNFELYSNFTFFLEDPINGDQIRQKESRNIIGLKSDFNQSFDSHGFSGNWQAGVFLRNDRISGNELSSTLNRRTTLSNIQLGDVNETNFGAYLNGKAYFGKWTFNPALRFDLLKFQYNDALVTNYFTQSNSKTIINPKLNIFYDYSSDLQIYIKAGRGFHSNDTRVVVAQNGERILPGAYGSDLGFIWKPVSRLLMNVAYWNLFSEQEFVYVGDAGIVEPSGESVRHGADLSVRYQPLGWLFWNFDANYAFARSVEGDADNNYIPLAPSFTLASGVKIVQTAGLYAGVNVRYLGDRPANEDNSIVAKGYTVVDMNIGYEFQSFSFGVQVQNLLDTEWNETQFATESRLQNEMSSVEEIHFTPGTPFLIRGSIEYKF